MIITSITVSYGETQSLPEYSNVKPALTLTAELAPNDDATAVEAALWEQAKQSVHAQIDAALEGSGKPAKYDPCPRFQVLKTFHDRYAPQPETMRAVWARLTVMPNVSLRALAAELHCSYSVVGRAIRLLRAAGYVEEAPGTIGARRVLVPFVASDQAAGWPHKKGRGI